MSMFSTHYLIRCERWGYWLGGPPEEAASWSKVLDYIHIPIRIFARRDAEALCAGVLKHIPNLKIEEDE